MTTTYGLTALGPVRPTAAEIRARIVTGTRAIPRFANARTTSGSGLGELIDVFVNEISQDWEAWEASVHAFSRDSASGQSLDALLTLIGKSRTLASYTLADLTLWSVSDAEVDVPLGNQAAQTATGVLFETLEDAVIPAGVNVIEEIAVGAVAWQSASTIRYAVAAGTDLSATVAGHLFVMVDSAKSSNNGTFAITAVSNGSHWVEVTNPLRSSNTDDEADSPGTATITDARVTVLARATNKGETTATAQSINAINTPVTDWAGVINLADAITGRDTESDAEVRLRVPQELSIAQGSTVEAVKEQLRKVDGVTYVAGDSDDDPSSATYGYAFTVVGGTNQDILDCIGKYKAGGVPTVGTTSGTYTNPEGQSKTIRFSRSSGITIYLQLNRTKGAGYPSNGDDLLSAALVAFGRTLTNGQDVYNFALVGATVGAAVPGITALTIYADTSASPSAANDIAISPTEVGVIAAENITFNP